MEVPGKFIYLLLLIFWFVANLIRSTIAAMNLVWKISVHPLSLGITLISFKNEKLLSPPKVKNNLKYDDCKFSLFVYFVSHKPILTS